MAGRRNVTPEVEGRARDIARGGDAAVLTDRGLIFVAGVAPGERVRLGALERQGKITRASLIEVLEPSPMRVEAPCAVVARCGGCPLMHLAIEAQHTQKLAWLRDALRQGGREDLPIELHAADEALGYRRRARWAFDRGRGRAFLGYHAFRSRSLVDVDHCVVLHPVLAQALALLRRELLPMLEGAGEVRAAIGAGALAVIVIEVGGTQSAAAYAAIERLVTSRAIAGAALRVGPAGAPALFGDAREETMGADGLPLEGTVGGFSQAHGTLNHALAATVVSLAESRDLRVLELYAGSGNLTVMLARNASDVAAVESDPDAAAACRRNLARRGLGRARVITGDASAHSAGGQVDVVVLDPPRTGAKEALEGLVRRKAKRIVYVSCDTATLGRDLAHLRTLGYTADRAHAFDMFPQAAHVESVVRLTRG